MRGPALAVSNNGTELREQLADQSPWFRCDQRPPPLLPFSPPPAWPHFLPALGASSLRGPGLAAPSAPGAPGSLRAASLQPAAGSPAAFGERRGWWPFCWRRRGRRAFVLS